jgi:hypothetical protein
MRLKRGRTGREDAGGDDSFYRPHQPRQVYFIVVVIYDSFINVFFFFCLTFFIDRMNNDRFVAAGCAKESLNRALREP